MQPHDTTANYIEKLIEFAAGLSNLADLRKILDRAAEIASPTDACIIWDEVPRAADVSLCTAHLYALAQWCRDDEHWLTMEVPVGNSLTGEAIMGNSPWLSTPDLHLDGRTYKKDPWLSRFGPGLSIPVRLESRSNGEVVEHRGAVNFYRFKGQQPFSPVEADVLAHIGRLIPHLYRSLRDRVAFDLLMCLDRRLDEASRAEPLLHEAKLIADKLRCEEVSIFLGRPGDETFHLRATTIPDKSDLFGKVGYKLTDPGIVPWLLNGREASIRLLDVRKLTKSSSDFSQYYAAHVAHRYPHLRWSEWKGAAEKPISCMAALITDGRHTLGVIQCSRAAAEPYYFGGRELEMLELAADRIGRHEGESQRDRDMQQEVGSWNALSRILVELSNMVTQESADAIVAESLFLNENRESVSRRTLEIFVGSVPGAERATAYWRDPAASNSGSLANLWLKALAPGVKSAVVKSSESPEPQVDALVAEISCGAPLGVLVIHLNSNADVPPHSQTLAEILGRQLGLYHHLYRQQDKLRKQLLREVRTFADLRHQIKSPILMAYRYLCAMYNSFSDAESRRKLGAIRGLTSKSLGVAGCVGLYADLAEGKPIAPHLAPMSADSILTTVVESAIDHEMICRDDTDILFSVDHGSFKALNRIYVRINRELFMQCMTNLLDNAAKYSFPKTTVRIRATLADGFVVVSVTNRGVSLSLKGAGMCWNRGWRGQYVREKMKSSGHGIGLWLVHEIMKAHDGRAKAIPTQDKETEFQLYFPKMDISRG